MAELVRCNWCLKDDLYKNYHDTEWGIPVHDDTKLFEMLCLEGAQAGLSWYTVLVKRGNYRKAFDNWNAKKITLYSEEKIKVLMSNEGIIRNKLKIRSVITNASAFLKVQEEFVSFDQYIWQFTNNQTITNYWDAMKDVPAKTKESDAMSKDLLTRGFKFTGSTICYAFMQATGMVDDHLSNCWKRNNQK